MTRIRTDNVFGTITDNPLTNGATTMNSAGLANLAAVSSAEALIILDPNRVNGAPEIVVVTAHTGSATSATIQRGQFGTAARQHPQGTFWVHGPIAGNASTFVTAADDQGDYVPMNAWETFTPTLVQSGAVTKTVTRAVFQRVGRLITVQYALNVTGTGTASNAVIIGLPVAAATNSDIMGGGRINDASAGLAYKGLSSLNTSTTFGLLTVHSTNNNFLGAVDFTAALASGDYVAATVTYEAAT